MGVPAARPFLQRLASFCRVIVFDKRGLGLSDPLPLHHAPTWMPALKTCR